MRHIGEGERKDEKYGIQGVQGYSRHALMVLIEAGFRSHPIKQADGRIFHKLKRKYNQKGLSEKNHHFSYPTSTSPNTRRFESR